jgi:integrase
MISSCVRSTGSGCIRTTIDGHFTRLIAQLELPKIPPKNLRHTHATYLISIGISPKIVQERLGHAHIKTTLGTYSHVLPSMQAELVGKLDDLVAKV